jgi:hypothetical protein
MLIIELSRLIFEESKTTESCIMCSKVDRLLPCCRVSSSMNMLGSANDLGRHLVVVVAQYDGVTVLSSKSQCVLRDPKLRTPQPGHTRKRGDSYLCRD